MLESSSSSRSVLTSCSILEVSNEVSDFIDIFRSFTLVVFRWGYSHTFHQEDVRKFWAIPFSSFLPQEDPQKAQGSQCIVFLSNLLLKESYCVCHTFWRAMKLLNFENCRTIPVFNSHFSYSTVDMSFINKTTYLYGYVVDFVVCYILDTFTYQCFSMMIIEFEHITSFWNS